MKYDLEELINETYKNKQEPPEQLNISVLKKMEEHVMKKKQKTNKMMKIDSCGMRCITAGDSGRSHCST